MILTPHDLARGRLSARIRATAAALVILLSSQPASSGNKTLVLNGQTLDLNGAIYRLYGIEAPLPGHMCHLRGAMRDCGRLARAALMDLAAGARIVCSDAPSGATGSQCLADGYDMSEGMVYAGWARTRPDAPDRFSRLMSEARRKRRGLWHTP